MKIITRVIIGLLLIIIMAVIALYLLCNTQWGTEQVRDYLNKNSKVQISFSGIDYRWPSWDVITLTDLKLGQPNAAPWLTAKAADITLSTRQISEANYPQSITLRDGALALSAIADAPGIRADALRFSNMRIVDESSEITAKGVSATFAPWLPLAGKPLGSQSSLQMRAAELTFSGTPAKNVWAQGNWSDKGLNITAFNAEVAGGGASGSLQRDASERWHVSDLNLTALRMQTGKTLNELLRPLIDYRQLIIIDSLKVENARLEGKAWAVTDLNLALSNLTLGHGSWQSESGKLTARASEAVIGNVYLQQPELAAAFSPDGIAFNKLASGWEKGTINADGQWSRSTRRLAINQLTLNHLEFTLPANWKTFFTHPLPNWLTDITVQQLTASQNLMIDVDSHFPWQITALDGAAQGLTLAQGRQWGVWRGQGEFGASAATFNRTDIARPAIAFNADSSAITVGKLTGLVDKGQLGATASMTQDNTREIRIRLLGRGVDANVLNNWGWPAIALPGAANLTLQAEASLAADRPLRPSVNATLEVTGNNGKVLRQVMRQGVVAQ